ncbi:MAG: hypothetical protein JO323_24650 [Acidobacteriia bacterium]|nr:hypothetical protein [Terriglobia bacterium]
MTRASAQRPRPTPRRAIWCATLSVLLLPGCGRYSEFTLPRLGGGPNLTYRWDPQPQPVLARGGTWDSHDVLNPAVVQVVSGSGSRPSLYNFYSGFDGRAWRTGLATSDDGVTWRKQGLVLAPDPRTWEGSHWATNGAALFDGRQFWYWYQAGPSETPHLGLARSRDGRTWIKQAGPVLDPGPRGSWDERGVADPYVIGIGPWLYLFYLGQDRAREQRLGVARSRDGIKWEKLRSNPILELGTSGTFDENGLGEPAVWSARGFYWMLYTGRDVRENRRLGLARSTDGVHWQKQASVFSGSEAWDSEVICDPTVLATDSEVRVWFGGGNVPHPAENINGQIGFAVLHPVNATLAK